MTQKERRDRGWAYFVGDAGMSRICYELWGELDLCQKQAWDGTEEKKDGI